MACPEKNFLDPQVLLITLNPGGDDGRDWGDPEWSQEHGSAYVCESWGDKPAGRASLQIQIQRMFNLLNLPIDEAAAGYFIPFRSQRESTLKNATAALQFAKEFWNDVIRGMAPEYVICLGATVGNHMKNLFGVRSLEKRPTGWGNVTLSIGDTKDGGRFVILPHLSTFKLFSRDACIAHFRAAVAFKGKRHA